MTNISQHLPEQSKTVEAIFAHYKKVGDAEPVRGYLGASIIGHGCERYLWYCFRQCCKPEFSGRMYRLFETGDLEENRFVDNLRKIGCTVHDVDTPLPLAGTGDDGVIPKGSIGYAIQKTKQFEVLALGGHFAGHLDGAAIGIPEAPKTWHVLEFKTHNAKSFKDLTKKGVKESKPQHYAQMMICMHLTGMKRALYLAVNKDTDDLHSERICYNKAEAEQLMDRAKRVITAISPPDRRWPRPDFYQCSWCNAKEICWGTNHKKDILGVVPDGPALPVPSLSCRQCCYATPVIDEDGALWSCRKTGCTQDSCIHYLLLPGLITFAEPTDYGRNKEGNDFIEFTNEDGTKWIHGAGGFSSEELMKLPANALGRPMLNSAKDLFGATVTDCGEDLLHRYPKDLIVWEGPGDELPRAWRVLYNEELLELKPIARNIEADYSVVELEGNRIAIIYRETATAEIRERK